MQLLQQHVSRELLLVSEVAAARQCHPQRLLRVLLERPTPLRETTRRHSSHQCREVCSGSLYFVTLFSVVGGLGWVAAGGAWVAPRGGRRAVVHVEDRTARLIQPLLPPGRQHRRRRIGGIGERGEDALLELLVAEA